MNKPNRTNFLKKAVGITLALVLTLGMACPVFAAAGYYDVPDDHWALENIKFANEMKIINGYWDGTFKPENSVTKEEAATMLYRALEAANALETNQDLSDGYTQLFDNCKIAEYARKYIAYFLKYGVINEEEISDFSKGDAQGVVAPRIQTAVWISKALNRSYVGAYYVPYTDIKDIRDEEMPYVDCLYRNGIMKGSLSENGTVSFMPKAGVKRCEFAAIANRVYEFKMAERAAGNSGYYDEEKETVCYNNSISSVKLAKNAIIIFNGEKVDSLAGLVDSDEIVKISSMTLVNTNDVQVLVDSKYAAKMGIVSDVTALSSKITRVGIKVDDYISYYLINSETRMASDLFIYDLQGKTVEFISNGVYLVEIDG